MEAPGFFPPNMQLSAICFQKEPEVVYKKPNTVNGWMTHGREKCYVVQRGSNYATDSEHPSRQGKKDPQP